LERAIGQRNKPALPSDPNAVPQLAEVIPPREAIEIAPLEDSNALLLAEIKKLREQIAELTKRLEAVESKQPQD
jgi:ubiquinone biosynthesis protein UbiJ